MPELKDTIKTSAQGPKSATVDGVNAQQHSLPDQIAADKHLAQKAVAAHPANAMRRARIVPPGAV